MGMKNSDEFNPNQTFIIEQGDVSDCYLLAETVCVLQLGKDGQEAQQRFTSRFHRHSDGSISVILNNVKEVQPDLVGNEHYMLNNPTKIRGLQKSKNIDLSTSHVITITPAKVKEIMSEKDRGVKSNYQEIKLLEHILGHYIKNTSNKKQSDLNFNDTLDFHAYEHSRFMIEETSAIAMLLGFEARDFGFNPSDKNSVTDKIIQLKKILPDQPVYIGMNYGVYDANKKRHNRHALRIDEITTENGEVVFYLINPWNNKQRERYTQAEINGRNPQYSTFSLNPKDMNQVEGVIQRKPDSLKEVLLNEYPNQTSMRQKIKSIHSVDKLEALIKYHNELKQFKKDIAAYEKLGISELALEKNMLTLEQQLQMHINNSNNQEFLITLETIKTQLVISKELAFNQVRNDFNKSIDCNRVLGEKIKELNLQTKENLNPPFVKLPFKDQHEISVGLMSYHIEFQKRKKECYELLVLLPQADPTKIRTLEKILDPKELDKFKKNCLADILLADQDQLNQAIAHLKNKIPGDASIRTACTGIAEEIWRVGTSESKDSINSMIQKGDLGNLKLKLKNLTNALKNEAQMLYIASAILKGESGNVIAEGLQKLSNINEIETLKVEKASYQEAIDNLINPTHLQSVKNLDGLYKQINDLAEVHPIFKTISEKINNHQVEQLKKDYKNSIEGLSNVQIKNILLKNLEQTEINGVEQLNKLSSTLKTIKESNCIKLLNEAKTFIEPLIKSLYESRIVAAIKSGEDIVPILNAIENEIAALKESVIKECIEIDETIKPITTAPYYTASSREILTGLSNEALLITRNGLRLKKECLELVSKLESLEGTPFGLKKQQIYNCKSVDDLNKHQNELTKAITAKEKLVHAQKEAEVARLAKQKEDTIDGIKKSMTSINKLINEINKNTGANQLIPNRVTKPYDDMDINELTKYLDELKQERENLSADKNNKINQKDDLLNKCGTVVGDIQTILQILNNTNDHLLHNYIQSLNNQLTSTLTITDLNKIHADLQGELTKAKSTAPYIQPIKDIISSYAQTHAKSTSLFPKFNMTKQQKIEEITNALNQIPLENRHLIIPVDKKHTEQFAQLSQADKENIIKARKALTARRNAITSYFLKSVNEKTGEINDKNAATTYKTVIKQIKKDPDNEIQEKPGNN